MTRRERLCYAAGDVPIAVRNASVLNFLLFFYTNVVMLDAWLAGLALAIGRIWDGINDPLVGYVSDRTRSRFGRRRPYLLGSTVPLGLAFYLLFSPPAGLDDAGAFVLLTVTYFILDAFFTLYATPYMALGAELSTDYHERTQLVALRMFFHLVGALVTVVCLSAAAGGASPTAIELGAASLPPPEEMRAAFRAAAGFLALVIVASGLVGFLGCRERPPRPREDAFSFRGFVADLMATLQNRPFRIILVTFAVMTFGVGVSQPLAVYVYRDWLRISGAELPAIMMLYLVSSAVSLGFWSGLARRFGKNRAFEACVLTTVILLATFPLVGATTPRAILYFFMVAAGFGAGGFMLPMSIAADVVDHDEVRTGNRREGAFFGLWTLTMKLASALAIAFVGFAIDLLGYVPNQVQEASTLLGLRILYGPSAAAFFFVSLLVFRRFPLTRETHAEVRRELEARGGPTPDGGLGTG